MEPNIWNLKVELQKTEPGIFGAGTIGGRLAEDKSEVETRTQELLLVGVS